MSTDRPAADPLADWADSGVMALTGLPTGAPMAPPGHAATIARRITDRLGLPVDGARLLAERAAFTGHQRQGAVSPSGACRLLPTADGWAAVSCARPDDPALLGALVGATLPENPWPAVAAWLTNHTGAELLERATLLGIAAGPIDTPPPRPGHPRPVTDLLVVELVERATSLGIATAPIDTPPPRPGHPRPVADHTGAELLERAISLGIATDPVEAPPPRPGRPRPVTDHTGAELAKRATPPGITAAPIDTPHPRPGHPRPVTDHTGAESVERATPLGIAAGPIAPADTPPPHPGRPRPMTDLLVVDFSALWAGPLCAHLLGLAGARVVKVETPTRPDGARRGHPDFYRLLHAGHRSVVLDPTTADGRRAMAGLVDAADIVIEASRPRALARFGLDAEAAVDAGTVWVSITAHGRASDRVGFGDDVAASGGLVAWTPDGTPVFCGDAVADPLTGLFAAELAMTAPAAGGALFDVSMSAVVSSTISPALPQTTISVPSRVALPHHRQVTGMAPPSGEHTDEVLHQLGIRSP